MNKEEYESANEVRVHCEDFGCAHNNNGNMTCNLEFIRIGIHGCESHEIDSGE